MRQTRSKGGTPAGVAWLVIAGLLTFMVLFAVGCGDDDSDSETADTSDLPTEVGEGEGELNLVGWVGYVEDGSTEPQVDWVTDFEKETGCQVNFKPGATSDEMVQLMRTGQYDGVSASGDASGRLVEGGDVAPVNVDLIPNYADVIESLKNQPHNTFDGQEYGVPHGRGSNLLLYNTDAVQPAPKSWDVVFDRASEYSGNVTAYDNPIYIADAALYLREHNPGARDHRSVRARSGAVRRRDRRCSSSRTSTSASTGPMRSRRSRRSRTATRSSGPPGSTRRTCCRRRTSQSRSSSPKRAPPAGPTRG